MLTPIYLDNNATTKPDPRVIKAMLPYLTENYANSSSRHFFGDLSNEAVVIARKQVADLIGAQPNEITFTSGATEAINMAIKGVAESYKEKGRHIVTVLTEHPAVLETCRYLETMGFEVTYLPVQKDGLLDINLVKRSVRNDTILVCIMHVNNETGVIQPIEEISKITHNAGSLLMSDGTQSVGKIPFNVESLGVDLLCFSGHKFYAPKGIGALYLKHETTMFKFPPLIHGGGQENSLRSGTVNVPGIVALGEASKLANEEIEHNADRISKLRNELEKNLLNIKDTYVNGNLMKRIYSVTNICFPGNDATVLIGKLKNIVVSTGSACSSATIEPSHVLLAMGLCDDDANASIRFSLGKYNDESEILLTVKAFKELFS